jgi:hypothetical protein
MDSENRKGKAFFSCPCCGAEVVPSHKDDVGTAWFKCTKCGEQTSKPRHVFEKHPPKLGGENLPDVHYSTLTSGEKGVAIDPETFFLCVDRAGKRWRFKLLNLVGGLAPLTAWFTLEDPEKLRSARAAKPFRDELARLYPEVSRKILEAVIGVIQQDEYEWQPREEAEGGPSRDEKGQLGRRRGEAEPEPAEKAATPEVEQQADDLLRDPRLLFRVREDMDRTIKGEQENKLLIWLLEITSQTKQDYTFQTLTGESAVGKTALAGGTLKYIPKKWWKKVGRMSRTALDYLKDLDWQLLWIQEARGGAEAAPSIRLSSADDGGLDVWVTERDGETGKFATTEIRLPGRSVMTTTTAVSISPEDATRNWLISVDPSEEQTKRIVEYKLSRAAWPPDLLKALDQEKPDLAPVVKAALLKIDYEAAVIVPYAEDLERIFSHKIVRARRDVDKLLGLIRVIARLHQFQRPIVEIGGQRFIVATAQDALAAFQLGSNPLTETLTGLEKRLKDAYEAVKSLGQATNTTVGIALRRGSEYARRALRVLVEMGYVDVDESQKTHVYSVRVEKSIDDLQTVFRELSSSGMQKKVESWLSMMTSQPLADGTCICVERETLESAYFDPISGEQGALEAENKNNIHPSVDERLKPEAVSGEGDKSEKAPLETMVRAFGLDEVVSCSRMELANVGGCDYCGKKPKMLTHAVKTFSKDHQVCEDCAIEINAYLKKQMAGGVA